MLVDPLGLATILIHEGYSKERKRLKDGLNKEFSKIVYTALGETIPGKDRWQMASAMIASASVDTIQASHWINEM